MLVLDLVEFDYDHEQEQESDGAGGGDRTHTPLRVLDFESSASASSATPAFRAGQKLRSSSRACKPRGGPRISRSMIACRTVREERSIAPNEATGISRGGAAFRGDGVGGGGEVAGSGGGGTAATGTGGATSKTTGSGGVVVRGGNGCVQLGFTFGGGVRGAGVTTRRRSAARGRTGGGGCVPGGAPSASRKRRIRSASLSSGGRCGGDCDRSSGGDDSGFSASSEACRVSHLKMSAIPARTRKMSVSFIEES